MNNIKAVCMDTGFYGEIHLGNRRYLVEHIKYHSVIVRRRKQLEAIRAGFQSSPSPVARFLERRDYLLESTFPTQSSVTPTCDMIMDKLECEGEGDTDRLLEFMREFITVISAGNYYEFCW